MIHTVLGKHTQETYQAMKKKKENHSITMTCLVFTTI